MALSIGEKIRSGKTHIEGFPNINEAKDLAIILSKPIDGVLSD